MDNTALLAIIVALIPAVASVIALFKIQSLHVLLNSRLTELLRTTRLEGVNEGEKSQQPPSLPRS